MISDRCRGLIQSILTGIQITKSVTNLETQYIPASPLDYSTIPVAMMAPDLYAIAKITLMSEGFKQNEILAKKVVTIFDLMKK